MTGRTAQASFPRLMLAAPRSGSGKTVITCGLLAALKKREIVCRSFKCGPDYIDPMFHRAVLGVESANLDTWFLDRERAAGLFKKIASEGSLSVVEGVMGYYDGVGGDSVTASSYDMACAICAPVVLVVDGKGASLSLAALLKGFLEYRSDSRIKGVIFNRTSPAVAERLKPAAEALGIKVYGCMPECGEAILGSRHLGLVTPGELVGLQAQMEGLAEKIEAFVDVDGLLALAWEAEKLEYEASAVPPSPRKKDTVRIAIAQDEAFCFYYQENIKLLEEMGAEAVGFSPLHDTHLPSGTAGLLIGGGYPELYGNALSANCSMRNEIYASLTGGMPYLAECGGFMYLQKEIETEDGSSYPMVGFFDGRAYPVRKLSRFGYITVTPYGDNLYLDAGEQVRGHEFHYWDTTEHGADMKAVKPGGLKSWDCMCCKGRGMAGFPHLYYPSCEVLAERFLRQAAAYQRERDI